MRHINLGMGRFGSVAFAWEGHAASEHLVKQDAKGVDVTLRGDLVLVELLRRGVFDGSVASGRTLNAMLLLN